MWRQLILFFALLVISNADVPTSIKNNSSREDIKNKLDKIKHDDENMNEFNEISDIEDDALKNNKLRIALNELIKPLPAVDVKCLMSADRFCSKEMGLMKSVLIQAILHNCSICSRAQKERAGRVIMAMMAHHPVAWKLFLTRYNSLQKDNIVA